MKTKLILVPSLNYLETFIPYCDGIGIHVTKKKIPDEVFELVKKHSKLLVVLNGFIPGFSYRSCEADELISFLDTFPFAPHMVQGPEEDTSFLELVDKMFFILRYFQTHKGWDSFKFLLTFKGGNKNLKLLLGMQTVNPKIEIGCRWNDFSRVKFVDKQNCSNLTYLGFKNIDEILVKPPKYLITAAPFQAAMMGIDLRERERRPKDLIKEHQFDYISESKIALSLKNINAIREAICMTL